MEPSLHISCDLRSTVYIKLSCANERIDIFSIKRSGSIRSVITFEEHGDVDRWCASSALNIKQCLRDSGSFVPMDTISCESYTTEEGECHHVLLNKSMRCNPPRVVHSGPRGSCYAFISTTGCKSYAKEKYSFAQRLLPCSMKLPLLY